MSDEPSFVVEYEIETMYLSSREKDTQLIKVPSMEDAQEVAANIREDTSYVDTSLGQIWNHINYIRVYQIYNPVEL